MSEYAAEWADTRQTASGTSHRQTTQIGNRPYGDAHGGSYFWTTTVL
ncbi:hypothetical protein [Yoonia algicola]|uniref:Uncharacterized protein n=1 Tax=Yoonia algicola TaxID=3137368 RepID=A0AAN0M9I7_9RHOB